MTGGSDIRSDEAESAASEKEIWKKDKKEIKRLERKRKKLGKLCKEENVALDLLHDEDDDGQDGGHSPRHGVEPLRFGVDRLLKVE